MRGLKLPLTFYRRNYVYVAPLVGAWIEISNLLISDCTSSVAPLVGAWIEIYIGYADGGQLTVAPLVGAWIEIWLHFWTYSKQKVAPLVGAWIEMYRFICFPRQRARRTPRGCVD